jgi:mono/diheme cytochrome c family protein
MSSQPMRGLICGFVLIAGCCGLSGGSASAADREDFFEAKIRPILLGTCFRCHGADKTSGELRIDSREMLLKGGESGPAIVPGKPEESLLIRAIRRQDDVSAMPPEKDKALRADQITDFVAWVKAGAVWPERSAKFVAAKHWAFEPLRDVVAPDVHDKVWIKTSVDPFILARQEAAGARPAPTADKLPLLRRATFDLTGLPPTPEEVAAFMKDTSPAAFERVVDRLLKSPAYGERWGRHWLDVVRYADTAGETADYPVPQAWRYRNYVIDSFNDDKPYDEFLREQIAGDVLANQGPTERYAERVTATGYLAISRRFGFDSENYHHLTIQDTIDTLGQSVLGLSLGCARCHDHKFDALSMQDYYALYGIFDSSRYSFPGSEQKSKVRSLAPLVPPSESHAKWRDYERRVAALTNRLASQKQPLPAAVLRPLGDIDGDFELQAPAAGGSNGVLVPPWLYEGKIAVTAAAQSPFKNLHALGKVGASVPADARPYRITQAIHPSRDSSAVLHVNLDFRVSAPDAAAKGRHRFTLGALGKVPAVEMVISSEQISLRQGETIEQLSALKPNQWHNLQLALDLKERTLSGRIGTPGEVSEFTGKAFASDASGVIDSVVFSSLDPQETKSPAIELDNFGVQDVPLAPVSTDPPPLAVSDPAADPVALTEQLQALTGIDGDLELQTNDAPPASPWNPGPNSVVKLGAKSQSPYRNIFATGELGMHMPNRGEYDGFGLTLSNVKPAADSRLFVAFDFRCASKDAGGDGSWRYYLGHGPGHSAAVELFFNAKEFFRRSGDAREVVGPLAVGQWYQVELTLDLKAKTYAGTLASPDGNTDFTGHFATGWDGAIDYTFIDSYGHIGGVRPSLDADNFVVGDKALPPLDAPPVKGAEASLAKRRTKAAELRAQLAALQGNTESEKQELNQLLAEGPFPLAYGMAEGTPHNVRMQLRGEPNQPGDEIPRGFIKVLGGGPLAAETAGSGRLELAQWLTRPENPLTARVMVNRIWQYHFGRGIVQTPNDFGVRGLPPTHPELLDHLATQFIRSGWSVKAMHRLIMLSATYQQASDSTANAASPDLYSSFARRRLSAEEIRDAVLVISGELDTSLAREHPFPSPISWGYTQHGPFSAVYDHNRRSVYLMTQRLKRHPFLALFDGADPNATTAQRLATTVPTQALFFLNDPFIHAKAEKWAQRLIAASAGEQQQIDSAWLQAIGRAPTESERTEATEFLAAYRAELASSGPDNAALRAMAAYLRTIIGSNEFLHVD